MLNNLHGKERGDLVRHIIHAASDSQDIPQFEAEIDRLVYALYGLTEEEIAVVEGEK
jgi:adenine-specific DNA-methyltransferase